MDQIACLTVRGKQRRHYSFATKYCSWHQPEQFPIFDNQVASLLLLYKRQWAFSEFNHDSLRNYDAYKAVIRSFQRISNRARVRTLAWSMKGLGLLLATRKQIDA